MWHRRHRFIVKNICSAETRSVQPEMQADKLIENLSDSDKATKLRSYVCYAKQNVYLEAHICIQTKICRQSHLHIYIYLKKATYLSALPIRETCIHI